MNVQRDRKIRGFVAASVLGVALAAASPLGAQHSTRPFGITARMSVDSGGSQGNDDSEVWSGGQVSADGRFVTFDSYASNLVPGDTNGQIDIFVHDRLTGETTRVSVSSAGKQANNFSAFTSISADGRYIAFDSYASNLVPGDTNHQDDVFVHDRVTGETTRVSVDSSGNQTDGLTAKCVPSADGRFVAFDSTAANLVPGDTNGQDDIFVHDRLIGETTRVSVSSSGAQADDRSEAPALSADGRYVAFFSYADNLVAADTNSSLDVFVHDRLTGETTRVSVDSLGHQANGGGEGPSISGDGRYVAFESVSRDLVPDDRNSSSDAFVHDCVTGETTRVSVNSAGREGDWNSEFVSISADGRYVAFASWANNLAWNDGDYGRDVFVHDRRTRSTTLVSTKPFRAVDIQLGFTGYPSISADGRYVTFSSEKPIVPEDTNQAYDVFLCGPELTLDAEPRVVPSGQILTLTTYKSLAGNYASLWIVALDGAPFSMLVLADVFGSNGTLVLSGIVPPGLGPLDITFRGYGAGASGVVSETNDVTVSVQ
ncbi:MAG: calcium-binding protein [Planctomycetota bacterium]